MKTICNHNLRILGVKKGHHAKKALYLLIIIGTSDEIGCPSGIIKIVSKMVATHF